jgi:hypothetical protein
MTCCPDEDDDSPAGLVRSDEATGNRLEQRRIDANILVPMIRGENMIRKSGNRFSLATNAKGVCAEIMLNQRDEIMMRFLLIAS